MKRASPLALLVALPLAACARAPAIAPPAPESPIVAAGHPVLRSPARDVRPEEIGTPELNALIARMIAAMRAAPGVGLAAVQLGVPLRVIVLEDTPERMKALTAAEIAERGRVPFPVRVFLNPTLTPVGEGRATFFEGCLSVPGYVGLVRRYRAVTVSGLDERGAPVTWTVEGWPARILQHEVDHSNSVLYTDRMETRSFSSAAQAKARFAGAPAATILEALGLREVTGSSQ